MISIFTENLFFSSKIKNFVKFLAGKENRGPRAVERSLIAGLTELGVNFSVNKIPEGVCEIACVLSGVKTLQWAIKQKQLGEIKKLIVGPNIVVSPNSEKGLLKDDYIDIILVPSQWVKDYYSAIAPEIANKIQIWTAGVNLPPKIVSQKNIDFLIFNKIGKHHLFEKIKEYIKDKGYSFRVVNYGQFYQAEYFKLLDQSKFEIYLSESESQGLAMFEAWARGAPTFVWEKGFYESEGVRVSGKISAPFLEKISGSYFSNENDFILKFNEFINAKYEPREFVKANFTNKAAAEKYLDIYHDKKII